MKRPCKMSPERPGLTTLFFLAMAGSVFFHCTPRTQDLALPLDTPKAFSDTGTRNVPDWWWTAFEDEELNILVDRALRSNFDLETAWQRLRAAQAVIQRESSFLYPDLEAFGEGRISDPEPIDNERLRLGLASSYEVDLWGRIRSSIEAEEYRARAGLAEYQTAALSLSAEMARTWYQLMEAGDQLDLIGQQLAANTKVLQLLRARVGIGQTRAVDILRQQQLLESTREQKVIEEARIRVLEHQLAVLLGRAPQEGVAYTPGHLPGLPPLPETGLPVELIQRRPDVRRAFHQLQAADRDLAVAVSAQYPRLTLTASVVTRDNDSDDLFTDWISTLAGSLVAPLFDAGRRSAEVDRTAALKKERLFAYGRTILSAFREVEDALIQETKQHERVRSLEAQVLLARQSYEQLRIEYLNGVSNYIDVLVALTNEQRLQRDLLTARRVLLEFRIALYRALAGGFKTGREMENLPEI